MIAAPVRKGKSPSAVTRINTVIDIGGEPFVVMMQDVGAFYCNRPRPVAGNVGAQHTEFVAAIDLIFTGV